VTLLDHALAYAARGWHVFPLNGKLPITTSGFKDATTDPALIRAWWLSHPRANIGISTGPSGFWVLDIDPRHNGDASLEALTDQHGAIPETLVARTGGGGLHVLFQGAAASTVNRLGKGLDTRGEGGYIVAPPSIHPETQAPYEWLTEHPLVDAPLWLLGQLNQARSTPRVVPDVIEDGGRNSALASLAGSMRWAGASVEEIESALLAMNQARCKPPLDEGEVRAIAASIGRYEPATDAVVEPWSDEDGETTTDLPYDIKQTDLGNALRLERRYGDDLRFVYDWDTWLYWTGQRWARSDRGQHVRLVVDTVVAIAQEAEDIGRQLASASVELERLTSFEGPPTPERMAAARQVATLSAWQKALNKHATDSQAAGRISSLISLAQSRDRFALTSHALDGDPMLLGCANGTLDLRTGELREGTRGELVTRATPIGYDAGAQCPRWESFLGEILPGLTEYIQQAVGYTLTGRVDEQCWWFLHGDGANGKTVFTSVLLHLLGEYARTGAKTLLEEDRFGSRHTTDLAELQGARAVVLSETEEGQGIPEASIKRLTGGEPLTARRLYRDNITFNPTHKLWVAGNHKPDIKGTDLGVWRRLRCVPFVHTVPPERRDLHLLDKLKAEGSGILAWAVRGCLEWQRHGLQTPPQVLDALEDYKAEQDTLGQFLLDRTERVDGHQVQAQGLYGAYTEWCAQNGYRYPFTIKRFKGDLQRRGYECKRLKVGYVWAGLLLRA
jgi:putative DNA primase/helicase